MFPTKKHLTSFQRSEKAGSKASNNIQGDSWVSFSDLQKAMNGEKIQGCRLTEEEIKKLFEAF